MKPIRIKLPCACGKCYILTRKRTTLRDGRKSSSGELHLNPACPSIGTADTTAA